VQFNDLK